MNDSDSLGSFQSLQATKLHCGLQLKHFNPTFPFLDAFWSQCCTFIFFFHMRTECGVLTEITFWVRIEGRRRRDMLFVRKSMIWALRCHRKVCSYWVCSESQISYPHRSDSHHIFLCASFHVVTEKVRSLGLIWYTLSSSLSSDSPHCSQRGRDYFWSLQGIVGLSHTTSNAFLISAHPRRIWCVWFLFQVTCLTAMCQVSASELSCMAELCYTGWWVKFHMFKRTRCKDKQHTFQCQ